jgi:hypothetical protein
LYERDHLLSAVGILVIPTIPPLSFQLHWAISDFGPDQPDYTCHSTVKDSDRKIYDEIIAIKTDHVSIELALEMLQTDAVRQKIAEFKATSNRDPSLVFWMS